MSFKQNNPLSRKTSPINRDWIKGAIKRPGAFKKKAEEAGMSTKAFAEKVTSNKEDYDSRTGKQAELAETLMGMNRNESPANRHTDKHMRRQAERQARKTKGDAQDIYYEMKSDKMEAEKKKGSPAKFHEPKDAAHADRVSHKSGETRKEIMAKQQARAKGTQQGKSPAKMSEKAAVRKQGKGKGKITVKTGGDAEPTYVSNRRQKRADKANDGSMKGIVKSSKILDKGRKIKDGNYGSAKKGKMAEKGVSRKNCKYKK